ncbi:colicin [Chimaeribacter arupi]|uniref:Colicin n=2 Tax=Yersiniaceae TaxID=1903411 RepID=A0A2N5ESI8_9GAMM|nr:MULTISPECIES: colicin immunity domain-containing protein [Yersiniaceae]MBS0970410.1 colicin [Nissabacter archeti]MDV5138529.1 colicin immunity domain-containing protein [Chimaeribacter arupi]PLR45527.1 colicin [Chimaeribacter arupi]PLR50965.1 colicin [Chimaeribacter arupi]PLR52784.1 colicin [Chimaeribacter arupi]
MSHELLKFAKRFVSGEISADSFADPYQAMWKREGNNGLLLQDDPALSEKLSTIFCLADQYNPDSDRHPSEFGADELKKRIEDVIAQ